MLLSLLLTFKTHKIRTLVTTLLNLSRKAVAHSQNPSHSLSAYMLILNLAHLQGLLGVSTKIDEW
jgi:hypothetical protein